MTNDFSAPTDPENSFDLSSSSSFSPAICVTSWHVNRSQSPDDKLADKLDANSISRMFRRKVGRGLRMKIIRHFLARSYISDVSCPCNLCELIGAMDSNIQLVGFY